MNSDNTPADERRINRRSVLKLSGTSLALTTGLAGCVGSEDGGGDSPTASPSPEPTDGTATGTPTPSGPDTVLVGQPAAVTGQWDFLQPAVSQSSDLATREINDAGGPLGAEFVVERRDTAVDPQQAREVVRQLVNSDEVDAITGLFSSEIVPLWDFIQEQAVPIVTPWPGSTFLDTRGGDKGTPGDLSDDEWLWRTVIGDTVHTSGAATAMIDEGFESMGVLSATTAGEEGWTQQFVNWYESLGGEIVEVVSSDAGKSSYQSELNRLFDNDFDAWALSFALEDATTIIRNWSEGGYGRQLLLEDGLMSSDLIDAVGEEAEGAWIAAGSTRGPNYANFEPKYTDFGDAEIHPWGVASYDATNVLALAIHHAGEASDDAIQQSIGAVTREGGTTVSTFGEGRDAIDGGEEINYEGAVTNVDFTTHGNVWGDVAVSTVTPDGFEEAFNVAADTLQSKIDDY